ncbi:MAG: D-glycerate dehydrogenase [Desulfovermiculus sp.]|nr:D-glycerate dehydrogenase [Desulfovermiculus sp.]
MPGKARLFLTRRLPQTVMDFLDHHFQLTFNDENRVLNKAEIIAGAKDCQALLCLLTDRIDAEVIESLPELKVISNYAVGFDNVDVQAATRKGIPVCNTPGVLTSATADLTWTLILAVNRRIAEADRFVRAGGFQGWDPLLLLGREVSGLTLGIVGMGRIGQAVARRSLGFDMRILYTKRRPLAPEEAISRAEHVDLDVLLRKADIISLHLPYSSQVHHLIDERALSVMKPQAVLINTARGAMVDETALVAALKSDQLAGAGLDVYEHEPAVHPGLLELDRVVLAPHIGSATERARVRMGRMAAENALAVLQNGQVHSLANPQVLAR